MTLKPGHFREHLNQSLHPIVTDGAMGTLLHARGITFEHCFDLLNLEQPALVAEIHNEYIQAGAELIKTNTFGANRVKLERHKLGDKVIEINQTAVNLAKRVVSASFKDVMIAGDIGPLGVPLAPFGRVQPDAARQIYEEQIKALASEGVDVLLIETMTDLYMVREAISAARNTAPGLPIIASMTFTRDGRTMLGDPPVKVAKSLSDFGADVIGVNCSGGPDQLLQILRRMQKAVPEARFSVMPNAGMPRVENGNIFYDLTPLELARDLKYFASELGANIIGGCCGTTPEHLKAVVNALSDITPMSRKPEKICGASSLYSVSLYNVTPKPLIIGERCNATGSKIFREFLLKSDLQGMISVAQKQEKEQAHLLDISTAYVGLDEAKAMAEFTERLNTDTTLPLMIDSTKPEVIENALQRIAGKAIINSVNLEDGGERLHKVLALCKKYGAAVVALTIDEQGMAKTAGRKLEMAYAGGGDYSGATVLGVSRKG